MKVNLSNREIIDLRKKLLVANSTWNLFNLNFKTNPFDSILKTDYPQVIFTNGSMYIENQGKVDPEDPEQQTYCIKNNINFPNEYTVEFDTIFYALHNDNSFYPSPNNFFRVQLFSGAGSVKPELDISQTEITYRKDNGTWIDFALTTQLSVNYTWRILVNKSAFTMDVYRDGILVAECTDINRTALMGSLYIQTTLTDSAIQMYMSICRGRSGLWIP